MIVFILAITGLWTIWDDLLPALGFFQEIQFWNYETLVDGVQKTVPITLGNILMAIVILFSTFVAVKNLPGLLEIILLSKINIDLGTRYAYSTVSRYAIPWVSLCH